MTTDVLEIMHERRQWSNSFKVLKKKNTDRLDFCTWKKYLPKIKAKSRLMIYIRICVTITGMPKEEK